MCTHIATTAEIAGVGKSGDRWFAVNQVVVGYDHSTHGAEEHALLLDFVNYDIGVGARLALELDLESGRELVAKLQSVIAAAGVSGLDTAVSATS